MPLPTLSIEPISNLVKCVNLCHVTTISPFQSPSRLVFKKKKTCTPKLLPLTLFAMASTKFDIAWNYTGGLSKPSKMPCFSYSIPASKCHTGGKLREIPNSVCNKCYAHKGYYAYPVVKNALQKRFDSLYLPEWVTHMTYLIENTNTSGYMRFHDSGDLDSVKHFANIVQIANNLPHIKFWLPTKEPSFIRKFLKSGKSIPKNLCIRLSASMIDGPLPILLAKQLKVQLSGVSRNADVVTCPAPKQENKCLTCRLCWNCKVETVIYHKH